MKKIFLTSISVLMATALSLTGCSLSSQTSHDEKQSAPSVHGSHISQSPSKKSDNPLKPTNMVKSSDIAIGEWTVTQKDNDSYITFPVTNNSKSFVYLDYDFASKGVEALSMCFGIFPGETCESKWIVADIVSSEIERVVKPVLLYQPLDASLWFDCTDLVTFPELKLSVFHDIAITNTTNHAIMEVHIDVRPKNHYLKKYNFGPLQHMPIDDDGESEKINKSFAQDDENSSNGQVFLKSGETKKIDVVDNFPDTFRAYCAIASKE